MKHVRIALYGAIGSGKTTCANYFRDKHGFIKITVAKKLKEIARDLFNVPIAPEPKTNLGQSFKLGQPNVVRAADRKILQCIGDALMKIDRLVWVRYAWEQSWCLDWPKLDRLRVWFEENINFVIEDVRFEHEYKYLKERDFIFILIDNKGPTTNLGKEYSKHWSEQGWQKIPSDYVIHIPPWETYAKMKKCAYAEIERIMAGG